MLKRLTPFILILFFQCSEDEPGGNRLPCEGSFDFFTFTPKHVYTGTVYELTGDFCSKQITKVRLNDTEVDANIQNKVIRFTVPPMADDSVNITLETTEGFVTLLQKIAVYPGGGTWNERSSFPAEARGFLTPAIGGNMGYVIGGQVFHGYDDDGFVEETYYKDVHAYNATTNSWSTISLNQDAWFTPNTATVADGKIFSIRNIVSPVDIYTISTGAFTTSGALAIRWDSHLFTNGNTVYVAMVLSPIENTFRMDVRKYNTETNEWDFVANVLLEGSADNSQSPYIDYAFVNDGMAYIGTSNMNTAGGRIRKLNLTTGTFTKGPDSEMALYPLFVIDNLAYFREQGESYSTFTDGVVTYPDNKLYIYNLKGEEWHTPAHYFPETVYAATGLTLNNRGFAGLGISEGNPFFAYSQKLFEFLPE